MDLQRVGVDVGGTFTDVVVVDERGLLAAKVPSTPADQSLGVMAALAEVRAGAAGPCAVAHGTTVATNALLERCGAVTALVTTEGFRDLVEIGRQGRPSLYDLTLRPPAPLVPRQFRFTVRERTGPAGELVPLDQEQLVEVTEQLRRCGAEAVAVCFLFSFVSPLHELTASETLRRALPGVRVSLSSEVLPEFREYERFSTTIADAYLAPALEGYLRALGQALLAAGLPAPLVMQSSGGVTDLDGAVKRPSACALSGPAGGVVGATFAAAASGRRDLVTFDMGGTSTDVALVVDGSVQVTNNAVIAGVPIKHTMVDIHTISAGGGSLVWVDAGGALRVGPRSAGAVPGPASYSLGGEQPALTDADLYLGYLADGACLGGAVVLDRARAERALFRVGSELGLSALETAAGAVAVAEAEMVRALRLVTVERGFDPREFTLVAFGGAGAMHACNLAAELGATTVLVPQAAGVLSALGLAVSDLRRDYSVALVTRLSHLDLDAFERAFQVLEERAREDLGRPELLRYADVRYKGQSHELTVAAGDPSKLAERFAAAHRRRYGFDLGGEEIEVTAARLLAVEPVPKPALRQSPPGPVAGPLGRRAVFANGWQEADVYALGTGGGLAGTVNGPAVIELTGATCVVQPGWSARMDEAGALVLEHR